MASLEAKVAAYHARLATADRLVAACEDHGANARGCLATCEERQAECQARFSSYDELERARNQLAALQECLLTCEDCLTSVQSRCGAGCSAHACAAQIWWQAKDVACTVEDSLVVVLKLAGCASFQRLQRFQAAWYSQHLA